jgi:hypothetical protein
MGFEIYNTFHNEALARDLIEILDENGIAYKINDVKSSLDTLYRGSNPIDRQIEIKIKPNDFDKVNEIWRDQLEVNIDDLDSEHYILDFTNTELFEIIARPDEWSPVDFKLAIELLKKRGKNIDEDLLNSLKTQRINDLNKKEPSQTPWIIVGYFVSVLGGILGMVIGMVIMQSKKVLPNGKKVYTYSAADRSQGTIIFYLGIFFLVVWTIIKIIIGF